MTDDASGEEARIAAVVLAAGRSSRMAPRNKLLEPVNGRPIVARVAKTATASGANPVIVVTGFDSQRVTEALHGLDVTIIHNPDFEQGLSTSLRAGIAALPANIDGLLACLGDMPDVEAAVLCSLIAAFDASDAICVPMHQGKRGNPVLLGKDYFNEVMALTGDVGAKSLLARHAAHVVEVEVGTSSIFEDIDFEADLAHFKQRAADR
jgi:molybdenum cofactor cytidylyltransferase